MADTSGNAGETGGDGAKAAEPAAIDVVALSDYAGKRGRVLFLGMAGDELADVLESAVLIVPNA